MSQPTQESIPSLVEELVSGNRRAVAHALSLVESTSERDKQRRSELLNLLATRERSNSPTRRIGISGSPGVGKSTLLESFGLQQIEQGHSVAVLAVDPSSTRTGGSILGDQIRMHHLSQHEKAFVRPSPSRLTLGGTAAATRDAISVCEAAGYDTIFVETVGVGQSEIEVVNMVDLFILLALPTAGDDVQGIKRGIMEVADIVALTKSDISKEATSRAKAVYLAALGLLLPSRDHWTTPVVSISATTGQGLDDLSEAVNAFFKPDRSSIISQERIQQRVVWFDGQLRQSLIAAATSTKSISQVIDTLRKDVSKGALTPAAAVDKVLSMVNITIHEDAR